MADVTVQSDSNGISTATLTGERPGATHLSWGERLRLTVTPNDVEVSVGSERGELYDARSRMGTDELVAFLAFVRNLRPDIWEMAERGSGYSVTDDDCYGDLDYESDEVSAIREPLTPEQMISQFEEVFVRPDEIEGDHLPLDTALVLTTDEAASRISYAIGTERLEELIQHLGGRRDAWLIRREVEL